MEEIPEDEREAAFDGFLASPEAKPFHGSEDVAAAGVDLADPAAIEAYVEQHNRDLAA